MKKTIALVVLLTATVVGGALGLSNRDHHTAPEADDSAVLPADVPTDAMSKAPVEHQPDAKHTRKTDAPEQTRKVDVPGQTRQVEVQATHAARSAPKVAQRSVKHRTSRQHKRHKVERVEPSSTATPTTAPNGNNGGGNDGWSSDGPNTGQGPEDGNGNGNDDGWSSDGPSEGDSSPFPA